MWKIIGKTLLIAIAVFIALLTVSIVSFWVWWLSNTAPVSQNNTETEFEVISGDTVTSVANRLEQAGIIKNAFTFRAWHQLSGDTIMLQRGTYTVSPSMTYSEIANSISRDKPQTVRITLREGARTEEYAIVLANALEPGTFKPDQFIQLAKPLEGMLFPDTYEFYQNETAQSVLDKLTQNFETRYATANGPQDAAVKKETIIIASLIEREGINSADRRMISGIIRNRLDIGMALQIDATLQYVKDSRSTPQIWWSSPTPALKELDSPYNTYMYPGLPPAPIANPGLDSIRAAIEPTVNNYLYYIHAKGEAYYARTLDQHEANIARHLR